MITRNMERGTYTHDQRGKQEEYPGVSSILRPVADLTWVPEAALNRGGQVHRACEIFDKNEGGGLHWPSLHPMLRPYVEAYAEFRIQNSFQFNLIEESLVSVMYRYGGTPDRFTEGRILYDIKCGPPSKNGREGLQLAGYAGLIKAWSRLRSDPVRLSVHLLPDQKPPWKIKPHTDTSDWRVFLALLEVHNWHIRNL